MKRILVTGGTGYIGSHVIVQLFQNKKEDLQVIVIDNLSNSFKAVIRDIKTILKTEVSIQFEEVDIRNKEAIRYIFVKYSPIDVVIHLAGLKSVPESIEQPMIYYENNIFGTENLLEVMQIYGCNCMVFSSSATVYGNVSESIVEDCPPNPTNPYALSKYSVEMRLKSLCESSHFSAISLRYFNPIGSHSQLRENPKKYSTNLFPRLQGANPLQIYSGYDTKDGTGIRDYIHVIDLADSHVKALDRLADFKYQVYNIGTGVPYSVMEVLSHVEKVNGIQISHKVIPTKRKGDVNISFTDPTLAKEKLQWVSSSLSFPENMFKL